MPTDALLALIDSYRLSDAVWPRHPRLWFRIVPRAPILRLRWPKLAHGS